jgi:hypothetical protein
MSDASENNQGNNTNSKKPSKVNVWSDKFAGGPLGLGDPNDTTLRHVEEFVFVSNIVQERAHREKCQDLINSNLIIALFL